VEPIGKLAMMLKLKLIIAKVYIIVYFIG